MKNGELLSQGKVFRRQFDAMREKGSNKEQEGREETHKLGESLAQSE
jgi:hypothetical protein